MVGRSKINFEHNFMRSDIQFLRGFAVLVVVLFHANFKFVGGGYLGVDIFFVISGFLITGIINRQLTDNTFSFKEFYFRRAKRLLPAAYCTFLVTAIFSVFILSSQELVDFSRQLIGGITFTANMVLWRQGTYFGVESDLKPLLHIWSLSIEEQYYFILPAALYCTPKKHRCKLIIFALIFSGLFCMLLQVYNPAGAFYLFPARAWELCIGSLGVFLVNNNKIIVIARKLFFPIAGLVGLLCFIPIGGIHPGVDSLLVSVGTLLIILANYQAPFNNFFGKIFIWLGDISYSLYLIHWPIFSLLANLWVDDMHPPLYIRVFCLGVSILLGYLQYRWIENPTRQLRLSYSPKGAYAVLVVSVSFSMIAWIMPELTVKNLDGFIQARRGNNGMGQECVSKGEFDELNFCRSGVNLDILIWGDSNAMHLVPGVVAMKEGHGVIQATKYVCGPLMGLAPKGIFTGATQNLRWAESCLNFNSSVLNFISKNDSIKTVVLSSYFSQYLQPAKFNIVNKFGSLNASSEVHFAAAKAALAETVRILRARGKKVIIVAPPPAMDFDAGRCWERNVRSLPTFGKYENCNPERIDIENKRAEVYRLLSEVSMSESVNVIKFNDALTNSGKIITEENGLNIFIANAHLSYTGSVYLANKINIVNEILVNAK